MAETELDQPETENKPKRQWWRWGVIIGVAVLAVGGGLILLRGDENTWIRDKEGDTVKHGNPSSEAPANQTIPQKILNNKFGWLGGGAEDDGQLISESGGAWARPHPGAFLWDAMQKSASSQIDFSLTDQEIGNYQKNDLGVLATIWPFADWDQQNLAGAAGCKVADNDEFLQKNDKKGRGAYLPHYRCKPNDWTAYQNWVAKVVERYDGDGTDDMPGLKYPVKHWEVMNEPDLTSPEAQPRLDFWKGTAADYAELLIKTNTTIKGADSEAKVLIAGAAGGDRQFLDFYREVLKNQETINAFDIANVHCISNDEKTHDFNVGVYKTMLLFEFNITKPIWVTEAEAFYRGNTSAEENYQSTKASTEGAIAAGAERIFFTRSNFGDFRTDMSEKTSQKSDNSSTDKYREIIKNY